MRRRPTLDARPNPWPWALGVGGIVLLAFWPAIGNGFVSWDDDRNFLGNVAYRGLGATQLHWMWTTFHLGHYVPLSWMTLGLDYGLWGMDPRGYHFTNVLLHCASAVLLFFVARRLLRAAHPSSGAGRAPNFAAAFAALAYALHPLRVESVAWVTERRDVLSGFFALGSALLYLRFAERGDRRSYAGALGLFVCALLSKASALTLPAVLLILDCYPLRRLDGARGWRSPEAAGVYRELLPFVLLSAATVPLTLVALGPPGQLGVVGKLAVSAYSLAFYLWKTMLPSGLSPLYAMPAAIDPLETKFVISYVALIAIGVAAYLARRRAPAVPSALLAFLVITLPLLGIVQNGPQIAADRYTYHAGTSLALLAGGAALLALDRWPAAARATMIAILTALGALTWKQTRIWHDSSTFWSYVVERDPRSAIGQTGLGTIDLDAGRLDSAVTRYRLAIAADSTYAEAHDNLGIALSRQGRTEEAVMHYRRALDLSPRKAETHNNLGVASARLGRSDDAIAEYREALEIDPAYGDAQTNWGNVLVRLGRYDEAIGHYRESLRIQPSNADAHHNWGVALAQSGRLGEAIEQFRAALAIDPGHAESREYLQRAIQLQRDAGARAQR